MLGSIITRKTLQKNISVSRYSKYVKIEGDKVCFFFLSRLFPKKLLFSHMCQTTPRKSAFQYTYDNNRFPVNVSNVKITKCKSAECVWTFQFSVWSLLLLNVWGPFFYKMPESSGSPNSQDFMAETQTPANQLPTVECSLWSKWIPGRDV